MRRYNGVDLPALPDLKYPNAMIALAGETYFLDVVDSKPTYDGTTVRYNQSGNTAQYYSDGESWKLLVESTYESGDVFNGVFWANFDILDESGEVWLAASNPVMPLHIPSFKIGLAMGLAGKAISLLPIPEDTTITGLASGLEYLFDQNTLRLDIVDSGAAGDSFSMVGDTLTINLQMIVPQQTILESEHMTTDWTHYQFRDLCLSVSSVVVKYNGKTYECPTQLCADLDEMDYVYVVGNAALAEHMMSSKPVNTGEPFALVSLSSAEPLVLYKDLEHPDVSDIDVICAYVNDKPVTRFIFRECSYVANKGMTWAEWINSGYNIIGMYLSADNRVVIEYDVDFDEYIYLDYEKTPEELVYVHGDDLIVEGGIYW